MARPISSIPYTDAATTAYPDGKIRDKDLTTDPLTVGTPITERLYGDIVQFFHKLLRLASITPNGIPEDETNGFQFITALDNKINTLAAVLDVSVLSTAATAANNADTVLLNSTAMSNKISGIADQKDALLVDSSAMATRINTLAGLKDDTLVDSSAMATRINTLAGIKDAALIISSGFNTNVDARAETKDVVVLSDAKTYADNIEKGSTLTTTRTINFNDSISVSPSNRITFHNINLTFTSSVYVLFEYTLDTIIRTHYFRVYISSPYPSTIDIPINAVSVGGGATTLIKNIHNVGQSGGANIYYFKAERVADDSNYWIVTTLPSF